MMSVILFENKARFASAAAGVLVVGARRQFASGRRPSCVPLPSVSQEPRDKNV